MPSIDHKLKHSFSEISPGSILTIQQSSLNSSALKKQQLLMSCFYLFLPVVALSCHRATRPPTWAFAVMMMRCGQASFAHSLLCAPSWSAWRPLQVTKCCGRLLLSASLHLEDRGAEQTASSAVASHSFSRASALTGSQRARDTTGTAISHETTLSFAFLAIMGHNGARPRGFPLLFSSSWTWRRQYFALLARVFFARCEEV